MTPGYVIAPASVSSAYSVVQSVPCRSHHNGRVQRRAGRFDHGKRWIHGNGG